MAALRHESSECRDLYGERVMAPRAGVVLGFVFISVGVGLVARRWRCCRGREQSEEEIESDAKHVEAADANPSSLSDKASLKRKLLRLLGLGVGWTMLLFLSLPTLSVLSSPSMTWIAPPRMVFSFTTIPGGITKIQPTLEALLHQNDRAFDAIYVIVPRVYRNESVEIPSWLLNDTAALDQRQMLDVTFATGPSVYHDKVHVVLLDTDYGPASKLLGALLVENDPETIIVYGDDDRMHRPELTERVLYYSSRFPDDAIAVLGGWIAAEDSLYCGRSLEVGVNRVSFVGGAGGVVVKRKFYGTSDEAIRPAFDIVNRSKGCFLGDDYYLSLLLSRNRVPRRLVYDTCWNIPLMKDSYRHGGLSYAESSHPGGANVEHYQQCIRELGKDHDLSGDGEFNAWSMYVFSHVWGLARGTMRWSQGESFVPC